MTQNNLQTMGTTTTDGARLVVEIGPNKGDRVRKCNVFELEKQTGITPRDSWITKARGGQVYFVKENGNTTAFLYLKDAKRFLKNGE